MQDQGKRLLLAVALALGVMLAWQAFFAPQKKKPAPKPAQGSAVPAQVVPQQTKPLVGTPDVAPAHQAAKPRGAEQTIALKYPRFTATFSSYGGNLKSWHLSDKRYDRDATHGDMLPSQADTGAFSLISSPDSTYPIPAGAEWTGTKVSDTSVQYKLSTDHLDIVKTFTIFPEALLVKMAVAVTVKVPAGQQAREVFAVTVFGYQNPKDTGGGGRSVAPRVWSSSTMRGGTIVTSPLASVEKAPRYESNITWTGFEHPYLLVALAPKPGAGAVDKETFAQGATGVMRTDLLFPAAIVKQGAAPIQHEVIGYLGPKDYDKLNIADATAGFPTGFHAVIDFGWFGFIGRPLLWLLQKFFGFLGNWGLAIVLLTILVKGITVPLITKSMRSMKAMAVLGPQLKELQKKYKDDKQRLNVETMALYKQYGVNPLSGCLPIVLQMPVWLALYRMLSSAGELYQQPFIPGWISDLTAADPYYVLPIILVVTMFAQARLTPQTVDPSQKLQQRLMQYGMPLMFGVMAFWFPAGLTLYIFTNTVLSAVHSIYMNKFDKKSLAFVEMMKQKQAEAEAEAAKGAKNANPKAGKSSGDGATAGAGTKAKPRAKGSGSRRNNKGRRR